VAGEPVTLEAGVMVIDAEGNEVEYSGSGTVPMLQLVVTYKLQGLHLERRQPGTVADMKLGHDFDCDPDSGARRLSSSAMPFWSRSSPRMPWRPR
jgi:hypothetical protein